MQPERSYKVHREDAYTETIGEPQKEGRQKVQGVIPCSSESSQEKTLSRKFWERFDVKHKKALRKKKKGNTSLKRVSACTDSRWYFSVNNTVINTLLRQWNNLFPFRAS